MNPNATLPTKIALKWDAQYYAGATPKDTALLLFLSNGSIAVTPDYWEKFIVPVVLALGWTIDTSALANAADHATAARGRCVWPLVGRSGL